MFSNSDSVLPPGTPAMNVGGINPGAEQKLASEATRLYASWLELGDHTSLGRLFDLELPVIFRLAYRLLGHRSDAEDVAQEVLIKIMYHGPPTQGQRLHFQGWLYTVTTHAAMELRRSGYRRTKRERMAEEEVMSCGAAGQGVSEAAGSPERVLAQRETQAALRTALSGLPETLRAPLVLHYMEELPRHQVAEILKLPESTLRLRLQKGLDELRALLAARGVALPAAGLPALLRSMPMPEVPAELVSSAQGLAMHGQAPVVPAPAHRGLSGGKATLALGAAATLVLAAVWHARTQAPPSPPLAAETPALETVTRPVEPGASCVQKEWLLPEVLSQALSLTYDGACLWLANKGSSVLYKIDPATGRLAGTLDLSAHKILPHALAWDGAWIWIANAREETLVAVTPKGQIMKDLNYRLSDGHHATPYGLTSAGERLYVESLVYNSTGQEKRTVASKIALLDPHDGRVLACLRLDHRPAARLIPLRPVYAEGVLWCRGAPFGKPEQICKVSVEDGRVLACFEPVPGAAIQSLAPDGQGGLWLLTAEGKIVLVSIAHLSP